MTERVRRPWGEYSVIAESDAYKAKTIEVLPGHRLSYQRHAHRSEHWFIVEGEGVVTVEGAQVEVKAGSAVDVPVRAAHRIHNTGMGPLVFVEVQRGDYLGEDDIVRLDDDYGRQMPQDSPAGIAQPELRSS